ncbi:MAG: tyrosine recombinase XerC [Chloroflexota bacterium]|nr:tyrosine recombinase XerC [Chloroflexota bacterium]
MELLAQYTRYLEAERGLSPFTRRNYEHDLRHFLAFLQEEGASPEGVDRHLLRRYLAQLQDQGIVRASIARRISALRSYYRFLLRESPGGNDPLAALSLPKREKRLPNFLDLPEVARLIEAPDLSTPAGLRDRAILELLYAAGLRVSEIALLDLGQVNLPTRDIRVWGKGSKERMVLMGKPAARILARYLKEARPQLAKPRTGIRGQNQALFVNQRGGRLSQRSVQYLVARYAHQAGLEKRTHPHLLRHTFATHLLDGGADLRVVQELLGHASLGSTQVYTHVSQAQVRRVYLAAHPRSRKKGKGETGGEPKSSD